MTKEDDESIYKIDPTKGRDGLDKKAVVSWKCPKCEKATPHRTAGIKSDADGKKFQLLECKICDTAQKSPIGEDGSEYQSNLDEPDHTDFGEK